MARCTISAACVLLTAIRVISSGARPARRAHASMRPRISSRRAPSASSARAASVVDEFTIFVRWLNYTKQPPSPQRPWQFAALPCDHIAFSLPTDCARRAVRPFSTIRLLVTLYRVRAIRRTTTSPLPLNDLTPAPRLVRCLYLLMPEIFFSTRNFDVARRHDCSGASP